jgi:hypothetical protein
MLWYHIRFVGKKKINFILFSRDVGKTTRKRNGKLNYISIRTHCRVASKFYEYMNVTRVLNVREYCWRYTVNKTIRVEKKIYTRENT